ncbi:MAG: ABC transporter substrate-binding protein [Burkholderiales bacterium]
MRRFSMPLLLACVLFGPAPSQAQQAPGVSPGEIKLGQTIPLSGPASPYGMFGRAHAAYFEMVNEQGGVNGRKIRLISLDDSYSPPKTVEHTRRLVEQENVLAIFGSVGTAHMAAVKQYLYDKGVPALFVGIGANIWGAPESFKYSTMWAPDHRTESATYARYVLKTRPQAKIAILSQNDDFGRNMVAGLKQALGDKTSLIVKEATFEATDPTVDSQILALKASGADTFFNFSSPKAASQAIRKAYDIGWKPMQFVFSFSTSIENVMKPAGVEKATGVLSATYLKDPNSPSWKDDPGVKEYLAWLRKYLPAANPADPLVLQGYNAAQLMVYILKQAGKDLNRESLVHAAKNVKDLQLTMMLPGIKINTTPQDPSGIHELRLQRFDGEQWTLAQ